ncbi:hypothetical protein BCR32DRAFT_283382 [Anaeromyces robustus]|uniref:Dynamin-type G domain-containing protein n=1 Tax=Anaeromyces robustus TaxID=1754192 RepID=A0A1Y1WVV8_9FUNG|nr:hypothetical protein BCR32DRAFT_283382 [Anaeromyces robustus]|eukprot:ORX77264.1 hypothetical protein BCR32DRAFT_283382 [Anaeromyces robustus]
MKFFFDKEFNNNIRPFLDVADQLKESLIDTDLPIIVVFGLQSHGKSSTLERIIGINLPKGNGTVTICPIKIVLRNSNKDYARVKFEKDNYYEDENDNLPLNNIIAKKIDEFQEIIKKNNDVKDDEIKLFDEVIEVDVFRRNASDLTLYDLPGLNLRESIQEQSEEINKKYLEKEGTTVLFVMSVEEEITNNYAVKWIRENSQNFKNFEERFNPVLTKADKLDNRKLEDYLNEIKEIGFKNKPSLLVNSLDETREENYIINNILRNNDELFNIDNTNDFPIYIGIKELINHLIEIQKKNLYKIFSNNNIYSHIKNEIQRITNKLNNIPENCKSKEEMTEKINECMEDFSEALKENLELLDCDENGEPKEHLLKYILDTKFKLFKKEVKEEMNALLTELFCKKVSNNIVETNIDNITVFRSSIPYSILLKPEIKHILNCCKCQVMLDRFLDMLFMNIKTNLYSNLTNRDTIIDIHNKLKNLDFESNKNLMGISPKMNNEKLECEKKLKSLLEAEEILKKLEIR